jgi:hypothetical protein
MHPNTGRDDCEDRDCSLAGEICQKLNQEAQMQAVPAGARLIAHDIAAERLIIIGEGSAEVELVTSGRKISLGRIGPGKIVDAVQSAMCEFGMDCLRRPGRQCAIQALVG